MGTTGKSFARAAVRIADLAAEERREGRAGWAARIVGKREHHALNDALITLSVHAEVCSCADGAVVPWTELAGHVWFVLGDVAIVDFGVAEDGDELVVFVRLDHLVVHVVDAYDEAA